MSLTSRIPLSEVKHAIWQSLHERKKTDDYSVLHKSSGNIERVQVWPKGTGYFGRMFGTPVAEVSREMTGLRSDMPDYSTSDVSVISADTLKKIVYGSNGTTPVNRTHIKK